MTSREDENGQHTMAGHGQRLWRWQQEYADQRHDGE
jgi:hypothetical protein